MSLYGTRDAAMNWQRKVAKEMAGWDFRRERYNPCSYWSTKTGLTIVVHGNDFLSTGSLEATKVFKKQPEARFEIKTHAIGDTASGSARACAK